MRRPQKARSEFTVPVLARVARRFTFWLWESGSVCPAAGAATASSASATTRRRSKRIDLIAMPPDLIDGSGGIWPPLPSSADRRSVDGELLRLRIQVAEAEGSGERGVARPEDIHALRDLRLIDEVVVPVRGPGAAKVRRGERWRIGPRDRLRVRRVGEVGDPRPRLVVPAYGDVAPALKGHDVVVVDRAVLSRRLRSRQGPLAELRTRGRVVEEHRLLYVRVGRLAFGRRAAARLPAEDDDLAVPGQSRGVPAASVPVDARLLDRVEEERILERSAPRRADAEHVRGVGAGADGQVHVAADHARVVTHGPDGRVGRSGQLFPMNEAGAGRVGERHRDDVHEVTQGVLAGKIEADAAPGAARVVAVDDQVAARDARHRDGVRAAWQLVGSLQHGVRAVADVEDVHALPAGGYRLTAAGPRRSLLRVPRADEDVLPDDDVALIAVALRMGDLHRVVRVGDVDDPPPVVIPVER